MIQKAYSILSFVAVVLPLSPQASSAAKPSKDLLPASTKFSLSIANGRDFSDRVAATEFGKLLADPALQPFLDDLPRQLRSQAADHPLAALRLDVGVDVDDLSKLSEGEVVWALVHPAGSPPSRVFVADVTNRQPEVDELLQKLTASMDELNATKSESSVDGTTVTVFDIPASAEVSARNLAYVQKDDHLVFAEAVATIQTLLNNLSGNSTDTLASQVAYQQVVNRCQERGGDEAPDAVLFLVPIDLSEALRQLSPTQDERADEGVAVARKHNFDAVSAVGSFITVGRGAFDFHLRISVYAPQPWKNGMRSFRFPNASMTLPAWVRGDNNGFAMINFDLGVTARPRRR